MVQLQNEVLHVLLDTLVKKELIGKSTYDGALRLVHSTVEHRDRFWCSHPSAEEKAADGTADNPV